MLDTFSLFFLNTNLKNSVGTEESYKVYSRTSGYTFLRWPNTVFVRTRIAKNKHAVNRAIILVTQHPHYLCYFSLQLNAVS